MSKLTKEQLSLATKVYYSALPGIDPVGYHTSSIEKCLEAAAPHLQIPWDGPNKEEVLECLARFEHDLRANADLAFRKTAMAIALGFFVQTRNDALLPKPVDPRREKIMAALRKREWPLDLENEVRMVDNIIAALDEVK